MNSYFSNAYPVYIFTVTNSHVGSGSSVSEEVDLPFQRDHLGYPTIYASSLKGAIKSYLINTISDSEERKNVEILFGKDSTPDEVSKVVILDAVLLLIPVRIIPISKDFEGVYSYATTEELLETAKSYLDAVSNLLRTQNTEKNVDFFLAGNGDKELIVNESYFKFKKDDELKKSYSILIPPEIKSVMVFRGNTGRDIINRSLIRVRRIRIDREKKTASERGLWSEEYVPRGTYFFTIILVRSDKEKNINEIFKKFNDKLLNYIIIGGHETIGKGIVRLMWWSYG
ncbi:type III-B CRISPR module RAMP protein Cmr4 [Sulfurisphaera tokodaii]|uniref:CRISPR-associated protein Cmr4 n=2 Tax=Sulfurisphaera tokodaii TaxID=111955 RepID=Q96Z56_SULTO|nr:type III-B CRISPR module RAMP protein Cmr4 [Sulfurisphaera tokodaii]BAB67070.1 putative CRISPR-associated protein Cmr4 [Sulfurisphaera tokodaii str. 7]HII74440.1 type III-B CRISPR module RAMP protein Cmr4 [Sulfurisphaera tokodaii]